MPSDQASSPFARAVAEPNGPPAFAPSWARLADQPGFSPIPGITMRPLAGGHIMLNRVEIDPNVEVPRHNHVHEQAGLVLEGVLHLTIGDETRSLRPGDAYTCPPDLPHRAVAGPDGCVVLDVFCPPREDYVALVGGAGDG